MDISVIVPIYNVEGYLEECVKSLLRQDINEYEILLVNDGSVDRSGEIALELSSRNANVRYLEKKNGGLSDARNYGLKHAQGKYVLFIDSDDFIKENCLGTLLSKIEDEQLDILVFNYVIYFNDSRQNEVKCMKNSSVEEYILGSTNAVNKLIRRSLLIDNEFEFPKGIWYEDLAVIPGLVKYTNKIGYINEAYYFYRMREQSIMRQKEYDPRFMDIIKSLDILQLDLKDDYPFELEYLAILHVMYGSSLRLLKVRHYDETRECVAYISNKYPNWKENLYFIKKEKLFRLFCDLLYKEKYFTCRILLKAKEVVRDE